MQDLHRRNCRSRATLARAMRMKTGQLMESAHLKLCVPGTRAFRLFTNGAAKKRREDSALPGFFAAPFVNNLNARVQIVHKWRSKEARECRVFTALLFCAICEQSERARPGHAQFQMRAFH